MSLSVLFDDRLSVMSSELLKAEAWRRLVNGASPHELGLEIKDGRFDLSGLILSEPTVVKQWQTPLANITQIEPPAEFRRVKWQNLDLSNSKLVSLRFEESQIINCRFDGCDMRDLRLWATDIADSSFRGADLSDSGLGLATLKKSAIRGRRNTFTEVDFSEANLRGTVYLAAAFERCLFCNTKLENVNFGTSTFVNCHFQGELREVIFWRSDLFSRQFPEDAFPPNEMQDIDFSRAKLRWVEFRGLSLKQVHFPVDPDHVIIQNGPTVLDKLIDTLKKQGDKTARILVAAFEVERKWAAPGAFCILNKLDLAQAGEDAISRVMELLEQFGAIEKPRVIH